MDGPNSVRYARNLGTLGVEGQARLLQAKVAVIGAGGLGGLVIELLARQGVGYIRVIDGDFFEDHNLNRQLLATEENLGDGKVFAAARRIETVNSDVTLDAVPLMLSEENAAELLDGMHVLVDALDDIESRRLLGRMARNMHIPLVHAAIAGFTGQVTTFLPGDSGMEAFYARCPGKHHGIENLLGNPACTPAIAAAVQAQEVVKLITGIGEPLHRRLFYFDTEYNLFEVFRLDGPD